MITVVPWIKMDNGSRRRTECPVASYMGVLSELSGVGTSRARHLFPVADQHSWRCLPLWQFQVHLGLLKNSHSYHGRPRMSLD